MNVRSLRVLSLQPWYGGSHRQFADSWAQHSQHQWTTAGLPARNWKWRMRYAAIELSRIVSQRLKDGEAWDVVVCTDMMNAAEFQSLTKGLQGVPIVVYFHENQFAYPIRGKQQPDHHFLFTNLVSALAADEVWFNSTFNLQSMLRGAAQHAEVWPDFDCDQEIKAISDKSKTVPPPVDLSDVDSAASVENLQKRVADGQPLHLVWAARWEYDKDPDSLLQCLELLSQQRVPFRLSVIGEQADAIPLAFNAIRTKFELSIENWGYQESRKDYWAVLESADVFLSTAQHEFFGLSAVEAMSIGCWPLLPDRLAYPEVIEATKDQQRRDLFLYQSNAKDLAAKIRKLHLNRDWDFVALTELANSLRRKLDFQKCAHSMDQMLIDLTLRCARTGG